jgi:hypothetical protein
MLLCTHGFDPNAIVDQTHLISLPVTLIEPFDIRTGEGGALETEINALAGCTVLELALPAMLRFGRVCTTASQTRFLFFQMHVANRAGHTARRQHSRMYVTKDHHQLTSYLNFDLS